MVIIIDINGNKLEDVGAISVILNVMNKHIENVKICNYGCDVLKYLTLNSNTLI